MTNRLIKGIETSANVAIIVVAVLLGAVLVRQLLAGGTQTRTGTPQSGAVSGHDTRLTLPGVDWSESKKTLVLALSSTCHFCTESAPFYQRLGKEEGVRLIAVVPQDVTEGRAYLDKLGVPIGDVRQMPLDAISVEGTPTLFLVDNAGRVSGKWVGKLSPDGESELLKQVRAGANAHQ